MTGCIPIWFGFGWWWIFPVVMMALCLIMMRRRLRGMKDRSSCLHGVNSRSAAPLDIPEQVVEKKK